MWRLVVLQKVAEVGPSDVVILKSQRLQASGLIWMRPQSDGWSRMQSPVCQRGGFLRHGLMLEQLLAKHSTLASVAIMMAGGRWWSSSLRWSPIWDGISWGQCVCSLFNLITILISFFYWFREMVLIIAASFFLAVHGASLKGALTWSGSPTHFHKKSGREPVQH